MAISLSPTDASYYMQRGNLLSQIPNYFNQAIETYSMVIELDPNFLDAYTKLAHLLIKIDNYDRAI